MLSFEACMERTLSQACSEEAPADHPATPRIVGKWTGHAVGKGTKVHESGGYNEHNPCVACIEDSLADPLLLGKAGDVFQEEGKIQDRHHRRRVVVVDVRDAAHKEEGEVVECPSANKQLEAIVEEMLLFGCEHVHLALLGKVIADGKDDVHYDSNTRRPPDKRIAEHVEADGVYTPR